MSSPDNSHPSCSPVIARASSPFSEYVKIVFAMNDRNFITQIDLMVGRMQPPFCSDISELFHDATVKDFSLELHGLSDLVAYRSVQLLLTVFGTELHTQYLNAYG
jgi:hypothetical protein